MPRAAESYSDTPFARMLTRWMWSQQPPWTPGRVAKALGTSRPRVANWLYKDTVPELDTLMSLMARLGIPLTSLLDAYRDAGLDTPPLTPAGQAQLASEPSALPSARRGRGGGVSNRAGAVAHPPVSLPDLPASQRLRSVSDADETEWETILAQTREVMALAGMPTPAVDALLAQVARARSSTDGATSPIQPSAATPR